jgi:hypothetical protein
MPINSGCAAVSSVASIGGRDVVLRIARALGAVVGYGCLAAFLCLICVQIYHWLRDGEWARFGVTEGLRIALSRCCVNEGDTGRLAALAHWLDTPVDWLGLHKILDIVPASLALFAISILGNSIYIYCRDRIDERRRAGSAQG